MSLFETKKKYLPQVAATLPKGKLFSVGYGIITGVMIHKPDGDEATAQVDVSLGVFLDSDETVTAEGREYGESVHRQTRTFRVPVAVAIAADPFASLYPHVENDIVQEALRSVEAATDKEKKAAVKTQKEARAYFLKEVDNEA